MRELRRAPLLGGVLIGILLGATAQAQPGSWPVEEPGAWPGAVPGWSYRARLGIRLQPMTEALREYFHAPSDRGVLVVHVEPGRAAEAAGVQVGDVVIAADGEAIEDPEDLVRRVAAVPAGEKIVLEIVRARKSRRVEVVPEGEPAPWLGPDGWDELHDRMRRGLDRGWDELRRRLEQLERRLNELERRLEQNPPAGQERT